MDMRWSVPGLAPVTLEFVRSPRRTVVVISYTQGIPEDRSVLCRLASGIGTEVLVPLGVSLAQVVFVQAPLNRRRLGVWVQLGFRWRLDQAVEVAARVLAPSDALIEDIATYRLQRQARSALQAWLLDLSEKTPLPPEDGNGATPSGETHE